MVLALKKKGESKDAMFRRFTRDFIEEDIVTEVRDRLFYKKPSRLKKEKLKEQRNKRSARRNTTRK
jgi:ribosomal protein S21